MPGYDEKKVQLSNWEYAAAGALSGAVTRTLTQPFDVIKVRFQLQVEPIKKTSTTSKYRNNLHAFKLIYGEEGIAGLWKGHNAGQFLSITYGLVQFQTFEILTKATEKHLHISAKDPKVHFVCGSIAGTAATVASFPFDLLKTRYIAQGNEKEYFSMYQAVKTCLQKEGPTGLYKGMSSGLLLVAPQTGAIFSLHHIFMKMLSGLKLMGPNHQPTLIQNLIVGSLAGIGGKTLVYPFDLARKRLQIRGFEGRKGFGQPIGREVIVTHGNYCIILGGDWNARIACQNSIEEGDFNESNLSGLRNSLDNVMSKREQLVEVIEHAGMIVCNCRTPNHTPAQYTCINSKRCSVIDHNIYCQDVLSCMYVTITNEGFAALYKGLSPSIIKAAFQTGLHFTWYDLFCRFFAIINKKME